MARPGAVILMPGADRAQWSHLSAVFGPALNSDHRMARHFGRQFVARLPSDQAIHEGPVTHLRLCACLAQPGMIFRMVLVTTDRDNPQ
jgi:hypothetical protein